MDLAQELTEARERLGWTQQDLADRLGLTIETVSNWERGVTKRPRGLKRIREALNLDPPTTADQPPTHQLDDDALWRLHRETASEIERRFYLRTPVERRPSGTRGDGTDIPPHLQVPPRRRTP